MTLLERALEWTRLRVGVVPVLDRAPGELVPGIRWQEEGPLIGERAVRDYWSARPDAQLAITLDNRAWGGPLLLCIDDDSGKHDPGELERPRALGGYRESTRGGGVHTVAQIRTAPPPDLPSRTTGVGGFVDVLFGGILFVAPTVNGGRGEYRELVPLSAGIPQYDSVGLALDAAAPWLREAWRARLREGAAGTGRRAAHGDFSECYRIAVRTVAHGDPDRPGLEREVQKAVGCDHPEWSDAQVGRTVARIRRWLALHPREAPERSSEDDWREQDWREDTLIELARVLGIDSGGRAKGELRVLIHAENERRNGRRVELVTHSDGLLSVVVDGRVWDSAAPGHDDQARRAVYDRAARGALAYARRMRLGAAIAALRGTLYEAPGFIPLIDSRPARDGLPCGVAGGRVPSVDPSTWRGDADQIRWNLAQRLCAAGDWLAWPLPKHVYAAEMVREDPIDSETPKGLAVYDATQSHRLFRQLVSHDLAALGSDAVAQYFSSPAGDSVAVISDAPPSRFFPSTCVFKTAHAWILVERTARSGATVRRFYPEGATIRGEHRVISRHVVHWVEVGRAIRPAADDADAGRMVREVVERVMERFPRGQSYVYWGDVLQRFREDATHFVVPRGGARRQQVSIEVLERVREPCAGAHLHAPGEPQSPRLTAGKYRPLVAGLTLDAQYEDLVGQSLRLLEERCAPVRTPAPVARDTGPPDR